MEGIQIKVIGLVQGVGFRWTTKLVADELHIKGYVRNEADGSVFIEALGTTDQLEKFTERIKASPTPSGRVDQIIVNKLTEIPQVTQFSIAN